ncbi:MULTISPECIES: GAF domain-containing protein [Lactobacillus]|uniref:GAF domain-containing protein n=1 Tax=Lactobacillus xujianguonis TaxID=2495899 RepID=A0A437SVM5_9LACO|nr:MULTISPECIES: GAF domain-containing protein [Lactobacillus]RVU70973.1 GAF domain-containing protein [Lactobacillus xujianguonis]RVU73408.1 GAF domain-containing protein [Lactobacillus xujianguonis]
MNINQPNTKSDYQTLTNTIYQNTDYDFVAVALQEATTPHLTRWVYASGNQDESFRRIVLRKGIGIAGLVMQTNKPFWHNNILELDYSDRLYTPIARVEKLLEVAAIPITDPFLKIAIGVLLVGYRSHEHQVSEKDVSKLSQFLND